MPVDNGVGIGPQTESKMRHFQKIARMWCKTVSSIFAIPYVKAKRPVALYVDATAGPGYRMTDGSQYKSAWVHFLEIAKGHGLPVSAWLFESNPKVFSELQAAVIRREAAHVFGGPEPRRSEKISLFNESYQRWLPRFPELIPRRIRPYQLGLLFVDPNGPSELHLDSIAAFSVALPRVDVLMYVSATALKRYWQGQIRLSDLVGEIPKDRWLVRHPDGEAHWTYLLGTGKESPLKAYKSIKLLDIDDPFLRDALRRMEYTAAEQALLDQIPLPFGESQPYSSYDEYLQHPRYRAVRAAVIRRAAGVCERCGQRAVTEVHHTRYPEWGTFDVPANLQAVCHECHCEIHEKGTERPMTIYDDLMVAARRTDERRNADDADAGFASPGDNEPSQLLATAMAAFEAGITQSDWSCVAEAQAMLEKLLHQVLHMEAELKRIRVMGGGCVTYETSLYEILREFDLHEEYTMTSQELADWVATSRWYLVYDR